MLRFLHMAVFTFTCLTAVAQTDLKSYYEQQKAAIIPTFAAPELGSQITVELKTGQPRTGVLMKLDTASVTMMADSGSMITYQRNALQEATRAQLFAEDYAHVKAVDKTRIYKDQQGDEFRAEQEAGIHDGSISIMAKTDKQTDKDKEEEERESKITGAKNSISTTTKTTTETQKLGVTITNKAGHADKFTIEYYFFGEPVDKGRPQNQREKEKENATKSEPVKLKIHDQGTRSVTVSGRGREKIDLTSKVFEVQKVEISANGSSGNRPPRETGIESAGYLVVLKYGSTVLDKKASARAYLDDGWLRQVQ